MFNSQSKNLTALSKGSASLAALTADFVDLESEIALLAGVLAWNSGTTYGMSALASSGNKTYKSIQAGNLSNVVTDTAWWAEYFADVVNAVVTTADVHTLTSGYWYGTSLANSPPPVTGQSPTFLYDVRVNAADSLFSVILAKDQNGISTWVKSQNSGAWSEWKPLSRRTQLFICYAAAATSVPNATSTQIVMDTIDTNNCGSSLSAGQVVTPYWASFVKATGSLKFESNPGDMMTQISKNGVTSGVPVRARTIAAASSEQLIQIAYFSVTSGDLIGLKGYQSSGGSINSSVGTSKNGLNIEFY